MCCLFCRERGETQDTRFRMGINVRTGEGHCFNCDWRSHTALVDVLCKLGMGDESAVLSSLPPLAKPEPLKPVRLPVGYESLLHVTENDSLFGPARRYIKKRGITVRQIQEHEVGATVADEMFSYRIIFPVRYERKLVGLVGRDWTNTSTKKYLNSIGPRSVYNANHQRYGFKFIVVSEGVIKALAIERATRYKVCSASLLGNQMSERQMEILTQWKEVCIFADPDAEGMKGFLKVAQTLQPHVSRVTFAWPWPKLQADDMDEPDILRALHNRREFSPIVHARIKLEMTERAE